ncbi:hypothetical protein ZWY2020_016137 [Hordeum vulgare]|nr:hypothetical protein ZWY2020_016137 [Hordeum vulgare]
MEQQRVWSGLTGMQSRDLPVDLQVMSTSEKSSWPELLGWPVRPAMLTVKNERPEVSIDQLPEGTTPTPPGFRSDRVVVFYHTQDELGRRVATIPVIG